MIPHKNSDCLPLSDPEEECRVPEAAIADEELATFAKALGHPVRIRIMKFLEAKNTCICGEIVDEIGLAQSTISQHLKVLKEAGLIQGEIDGPKVCYCINRQSLKRFKVYVAGL